MKRSVVSFIVLIGLVLIGAGCSSSPRPGVNGGPTGPTLLDVEAAFGIGISPEARFVELVEDVSGARATVQSALSVDEMEGFYSYEFESAGFVIGKDWQDRKDDNNEMVRSAEYTKGGITTVIQLREMPDRTQIELQSGAVFQ